MEKLLTTDFRLQGDRNRLIPEGMRDATFAYSGVYARLYTHRTPGNDVVTVA